MRYYTYKKEICEINISQIECTDPRQNLFTLFESTQVN
jgi:hypothetical protein